MLRSDEPPASAGEASAPPPVQPLSPSAAVAPTRTVVIVVVSCLVLAALVLAAYRSSLGSALGIVAGAGKTADTSTLSLWDPSSSPSKASANDPSLWDPTSVSTVSTIGSTATEQHRADAAQLIASSLLEYEKSVAAAATAAAAKAAAAKAATAAANTAAAAAAAAANTATATSTTTTTTTTSTTTPPPPTAPPSPSARPVAMTADLIAAAKAWRSLDMDRNGAPSTLGGNILKRAEGVEGAYGVYVLHPDVVRESSGGPTIGVNLLPTPQATCLMEVGVDSVDPSEDASAAGARSFADNPFLTHFADHVYHMCHPHTFGATFSAMVFTVSGPGAASATAGVATSISVAYTNTPVGTQVNLAMRLVGPSIVALEKPGSQQGPSSPQTGTYTVREPGMYVLEVLLSFVGGQHANHLVYRGLVHVAAKEGGIAAAFKDANGVDIRGTKRCAGGWVAEKPGRWVYVGVPAGALPAPHDGVQTSNGGTKLTPPPRRRRRCRRAARYGRPRPAPCRTATARGQCPTRRTGASGRTTRWGTVAAMCGHRGTATITSTPAMTLRRVSTSAASAASCPTRGTRWGGRSSQPRWPWRTLAGSTGAGTRWAPSGRSNRRSLEQ